MFKIIFKKTYPKSSYIKYHVEPIQEDYFRIDNNKFIVADGVTKDLITGEAAGYPTTKEEIEFVMKNYPNPSGSYEASKIICETFISELLKYDESKIDKNCLNEVIKLANRKVWDINKGRDINYIENDLHATVSAGGVIINDTLYCFSICDCHITLLDKYLNIVFTTKNNHVNFEDYIEDFNWSKASSRVLARRDCRNKEYIINGKDISYGSLTGEVGAEKYIDLYEQNLNEVKYICAYSDGCEPNFINKDAIKKLIDNPESIKESGNEKTLILYEKID
ncbi:MAG: hypothetical protein PHP54_00955 [Clostridia bacterium]|nr:hypothetical protein [Clostridia bacterium]